MIIIYNKEDLLKIKEEEKKVDKDYKKFWQNNKPSTVTLNKKIIEYAKQKAKKQGLTLKDWLEYLILK